MVTGSDLIEFTTGNYCFYTSDPEGPDHDRVGSVISGAIQVNS